MHDCIIASVLFCAKNRHSPCQTAMPQGSTLKQATEMIRSQTAIPCTACLYCVSENEYLKNIEILDYFALYNDNQAFKAMGAAIYYNNLILTHGKASECIGCDKCEKHCPQHLSIRKYLKKVAEAFE